MGREGSFWVSGQAQTLEGSDSLGFPLAIRNQQAVRVFVGLFHSSPSHP